MSISIDIFIFNDKPIEPKIMILDKGERVLQISSSSDICALNRGDVHIFFNNLEVLTKFVNDLNDLISQNGDSNV